MSPFRGSRTVMWAVAGSALAIAANAFTLSPIAHVAPKCRRMLALSPSSCILHNSLAKRESIWVVRPRRSVTLRMAADVSEVTTATLNDREFQLEEREDKDVAATSVTLNPDGTVSTGTTDGPLPLSCSGNWSLEGTDFRMEISREFDSSVPYTVKRHFVGWVDEVLPATDTLVIAGSIVMNEMEVGYFKMISSPADMEDALGHMDKTAAQKQTP